MIQLATGVELDGTQFCFEYQDQTKNTQGARRLQCLKVFGDRHFYPKKI
jgi:hypothetical protein